MAKRKDTPQQASGVKVIAVNKKARFDYHIVETFEAGIVLTGAEIKSIRQGGVHLQEGYVRPSAKGMDILGMNITQYTHSGFKEYEASKPRRLLLHTHEIDRLRGRVEQKGFTIVPLSLYLKNGWAKLEIGLAKGKDAPDKRDTIREREAKRELSRILKRG